MENRPKKKLLDHNDLHARSESRGIGSAEPHWYALTTLHRFISDKLIYTQDLYLFHEVSCLI